MRQLKNSLLAAFLLLQLVGYAQQQKIVVEITKEVNGEKKTFKGTYDSPEEMRADPNYQAFSGDEDDTNFWVDNTGRNVIINLDHVKDLSRRMMTRFDTDSNDFFFKLDTLSSKIADIDMEALKEKLESLEIDMGKSFRQFHFYDDHKPKGWGKRIRVTEVGDEFGKRGIVDTKNKLALDDLSFAPNPSPNGRFKIRFDTPSEDKLSIKISDLNGQDVFSRYFERFSGHYSESIDLSGQKEDIYLLEIIQGSKKLVKKIIVN